MIIRDNKEIRGNRVIWKYLSWDKFFDLIITHELYFARVSELSDQNECYISTKNIEYFNKYLTPKGQNNTSRLFDDSVKLRSFINCWTLSRNESYALWKIYLSNSKSGVAIKTTISKLAKAITDGGTQENIFFSKVHYKPTNSVRKIDFTKEIEIRTQIDLFRLTTKLAAYEYEDELRLICFSSNESNSFKKVMVDSFDFIEAIYFSPFNKCFNETYKEVLQKVCGELEDKIKESAIKDE